MRFDLQLREFTDHGVGDSRPAVLSESALLSWRDFEAKVAAWVQAATAAGAQCDVPIMIHGHKEADFLVAIAGCLALRAPFVPVDTIYPQERVARILRLSGANLVFSAEQRSFTPIAPQITTDQRDLAYVIFTSGSTGEPKGVQIGSESVLELANWMSGSFGLGEAPVFMNQAPFSFDLSMYELFGTLAMGGCCVMNHRELAGDSDAFLTRQREARITTWVSTPSFAFQQLLNKRFAQAFLPTLDTFLFCGEPLTNKLARTLRARFPRARVINSYGPTEATVATTWIVLDEAILERYDPLPVGVCKPHGEVFVDPANGELCIAGPHVMRGYLNREDLNREKLFTWHGQRAFRTGDLGIVEPSGLVFCHGRRDDQIKLNGYRIELSDVDNALCKLPAVSIAATIALRQSDSGESGRVLRLVGFIVFDAAATVQARQATLQEYRGRLGRLIPEYMIPSELICCDALPYSGNHKIDRAALARNYAQTQAAS